MEYAFKCGNKALVAMVAPKDANVQPDPKMYEVSAENPTRVKINRSAVILFPIVMLVFNVIYFTLSI